jgi:hypothetical protein
MIEHLATDQATVGVIAGTAVVVMGGLAAWNAKRVAALANRSRNRVKVRVPGRSRPSGRREK